MTVWYRKPKIEVSPADVAYFDDLRAGDQHPAAGFGDLPEEVQSFIIALEVQYLDLARERYFSSGAMWLLIGIGALAFAQLGGIGRYVLIDAGGWDYFACIFFIVLGIARFVQGQRFALPDVNERLREEWEIDYVVGKKRFGRLG